MYKIMQIVSLIIVGIALHIPRLRNLFNVRVSVCNIEKLGMGPGNEATIGVHGVA